MIKHAVLFMVLTMVLVSCAGPGPESNANSDDNNTSNTDQNEQAELSKTHDALPTFDSCQALERKIEEVRKDEDNMYRGDAGSDFAMPLGLGSVMKDSAGVANEAAPQAMFGVTDSAGDFSGTNVQVEGVDEADIVKNDGSHIYTVSGNRITISRAYPPENAMLITTLDYTDEDYYGFDQSSYISDIFINGDTLTVFGNRYYSYPPRFMERMKSAFSSSYYYPSYQYKDVTFIDIYDISDKSDPEVKRMLEFEGYYVSSRMINDTVYFVLNKYIDYYMPGPIPMPQYRDSNVVGYDTLSEDNFEDTVTCDKVGYMEPFYPQNYLIVGAVNLENLESDITKRVIIGSGENIYASQNNLYVAQTNYRYWWGIPEDDGGGDETETTSLYKFELKEGSVEFIKDSKVPGRILNQFSMDEYDGDFRIATTEGHVSRIESTTSNNVFVLNSDMQIVGSIRDIAPGEDIYSVRFMGERGYLVTFKKIDPFFVIDLADAENPKILGKLKIPGYSDYLHPYDENHIIGIGKETEEAEESEGDFAWYQGVKMAIFDVTDVEHPKEMFKVTIGDRGTDSPVLWDHKAFLFNKDRELLVLPVTIAELDPEIKNDPSTPRWSYGDTVYQGAIVYKINLTDGFKEVGRISHVTDQESYLKSGYYFDGFGTEVSRSLYMDNYLYTVSNSFIKINNLDDDLKELNTIDLKYEQDYYPYI
jgi:uncharacterized secreted protein with C-terminal beta-propeller domain